MGGQVNDLGYGKNAKDRMESSHLDCQAMGNPQPSPKAFNCFEAMDAVHRLNGSGSGYQAYTQA